MGIDKLPSKALHLGLTGGIGSGKSTVAHFLGTWGAFVIDADAQSRALTIPHGAAIQPIADQFGNAMLTPEGGLDREKMRALVFQNPDKRKLLEGILHPLIAQKINELSAQAHAENTPLLVFDIPLLVESPRWRKSLDKVLVVDCQASTQRSRVIARNGLTGEAVDEIMAVQSSSQRRLAAADLVLYNEGLNLVELKAQAHAIFNLLRI